MTSRGQYPRGGGACECPRVGVFKSAVQVRSGPREFSYRPTDPLPPLGSATVTINNL